MPTLATKGNMKRVGVSLDQLRDYRAVIILKSCLDSSDVMRTSPSSNAALRSNKCSQKKMQIDISSSSSSSPASRIFHVASANMVRAIRNLFTKKRSPSSSGSHAEIMNVQSSINFVPHRDSHHSEAFEDCIEFINSSYRKSL